MNKVLVIGSGGREDAICSKLSKNSEIKIYAMPGNPGTERYAENIDINPLDLQNLLEFCLQKSIDLVVIGPEVYLEAGLADFLRANKINVFGPDREAAKIESSKVFAKDLMNKYGVPTAAYRTFEAVQSDDAKSYLSECSYPVVVKADGLAAGKGVIICNDITEAEKTLKEILIDKTFGTAGNKIIIEEFLEGEEVSLFAMTDGENYCLLTPAQDYKKIGDGDTGKNTGGMGSFSFKEILTTEQIKEIETNIISKILIALKENGSLFNGCLYCGLILTKSGIKVIEFNCRFGDPETQSVLNTFDDDLYEIFYQIAKGKLEKRNISMDGQAITLVLASEGYPEKFEKGFEITGIEEDIMSGIQIFHAGTKKVEDKIYSNGGRVLNITSFSGNQGFENLMNSAYEMAEKINFKNKYYRKDIGTKGLIKLTLNNE